jgi:hypothetical protein
MINKLFSVVILINKATCYRVIVKHSLNFSAM